MAHFAEINDSNVVIRVLVVGDDDCLDGDGNESEAVGVAFMQGVFGGGTWKQTSYNNNTRKQYACIGGTYDASADEFVHKKPFASWTLDGSNDWQPPIALPADKNSVAYRWDEAAYQSDNTTGWFTKAS
tara:strand:- start:1887 stop:2273 length:387 start_codon:yes stop_codon:yes gene_type:complete